MSNNFFTDNRDLQFHFQNVDLKQVLEMRDDNFTATEAGAPASLEESRQQCLERLEQVGDLSANFFAPRATQVDRDNVHLSDGKVDYPYGTQENLQALKDAHLDGVTLPRRFGGLNLPTTIYSMMTEMVSRADASLQNLFGLQSIAETLYRFGSEEQRQEMLPLFASGEVDGAMALTEPEAGSDLQSVTTRATYDEESGQWFIDGRKRFITNGRAKALLVLARSEAGTSDGRGLSMFLVRSCPQLKISAIEDKLGIHGSPTCELIFDHVPAQLVGERRMGLIRYVMSLMNGARLAIASQAVGIGEAAYRCAREYAAQRVQFRRPIDQLSAVSAMLVQMKTAVLAGRALLYETSRMVDLRDVHDDRIRRGIGDANDRQMVKYYGRMADALTPLAKAYNTEMCNEVAYKAIQVHGGKGYMRDRLAERYYRDARITNIYEGTTQMQVIAAIAGVMKGALQPIYDEIGAIAFSGEAAELLQQFSNARQELAKAIAFVEEHRADSSFHEHMAYRLVRMETICFIGYILLRSTLAEAERLAVVREFAALYLPEFQMHCQYVLNGRTPDAAILDF